MATLAQLEEGLKRAYAAGNMQYARILGQEIVRARQMPGAVVPVEDGGSIVAPSAPQESTVGDTAIGALETGAALATGATGGAVGMVGGTLKGLAEQILAGQFGTQEAARAVQDAAAKGSQALTYMPRTQAGQEMTQSMGQALGDALPPVLPMIGQAGQIGQAVRLAQPVAAATVQRAAAPVTQAVKRAGEGVQQAAKGASDLVSVGKTSAFGDASIGAAETPVTAQRITTAQALPVPFEGKSGLTAGQASRNFSQLQFEKEIAKRADIGAPMRERVENQTATFIQNFDAMVDRLDPIATDRRAIGQGVDRALVNRAEVRRRAIRRAYEEAEAAGDMAAPVQMNGFATRMNDLTRYEGVSPNIAAIKREAIRVGAVAPDENGNLVPQQMSLRDSETLRQFVNESTDWMDRRQALFARRINESIDAATEGQGGEMYQRARRLRAQYATEFENSGLTAKLLGSKRNTSERQVAFEDVFDKVFISSPVEEMNKLRSTLLRSGAEGRQAWNDLKAEGINYIKEASLSPSQKDSAGNPLLSPDKLNRIVKQLDRDGKLESLYGKKQAQQIRDLAELSTVIYTAPPGAVNHSNTASALQVALDTVGSFTVTGMPAPIVTALRESSKYLKDRKTKARIEATLKFSEPKE